MQGLGSLRGFAPYEHLTHMIRATGHLIYLFSFMSNFDQ